MIKIIVDFVKGFIFAVQFLTFGAFTAYAYNEFLVFKHRNLLLEIIDALIPFLLKHKIIVQIDEPVLDKSVKHQSTRSWILIIFRTLTLNLIQKLKLPRRVLNG